MFKNAPLKVSKGNITVLTFYSGFVKFLSAILVHCPNEVPLLGSPSFRSAE